MKRNLKWFFWGFIVPMLLLIGADIVSSKSQLPLWRRILTLEDTCAYGSCFILPAIFFAVVLFIRGFWLAWLRFKKKDTA